MYVQLKPFYMLSFSALIYLLFFLNCETSHHYDGAHVHGAGTLTIAVEDDKTLVVELLIPSESIYGFEYEASTEEDKAKVDYSTAFFKSQFHELFSLPSSLKCTYIPEFVGIDYDGSHDHDDPDTNVHEKENQQHDSTGGSHDNHQEHHEEADHHHKGDEENHKENRHSEFHVRINLACESPVTGKEISLNFGKHYAAIEELHIKVIGDSPQAKTLKKGNGKIRL